MGKKLSSKEIRIAKRIYIPKGAKSVFCEGKLYSREEIETLKKNYHSQKNSQ